LFSKQRYFKRCDIFMYIGLSDITHLFLIIIISLLEVRNHFFENSKQCIS
jgi:hypothetical protein